ncbi:LAFE_0D00672g1_1 [Lachancea fermentati]|uniref:LAFE_0D00672g1_1 n=1 Tax=Lachancea fermentati TaxID=4955 RepID=A0A1G4MB15_LACFM|nr:LAFE_0D00672g1_1 [Lachancea fermentati]
MSLASERIWLSWLQQANRNSISLKNVRYRNQAPKIWKDRVEQLNSMPVTSQHVLRVKVLRKAKNCLASVLPNILLQDIANENITFKFCRRHGFRNQLHLPDTVSNEGKNLRKVAEGAAEIENWDVLSSLFKNRLDRYYGPYDEDFEKLYGDTIDFEASRLWCVNDAPYREISLSAKSDSGDNVELRIYWPPLQYSVGCRGLGASSSKCKELACKGISQLQNPVTGENMPILEFDHVPEGFDAIGLLPSKFQRHAKLFKTHSVAQAVLPFRSCTRSEMKHLETLSKDKLKHRAISKSGVKNLGHDQDTFKSTVSTMATLLGALKSGSLKTKKENNRGQMCSTDILRATILSGNITDSQLREEYAKISILYCIFQHLRRLTFNSKPSNELSDNAVFKPWDTTIIRELLALNDLQKPGSVDEMFEVKGKFDSFLKKLHVYNCILVSEMKSQAKNTSGNRRYRQLGMVSILNKVFVSCKWMTEVYPNLSFHLHRTLEPIGFANTVGSNDTASGDRVFLTVDSLLEMESIAYEELYRQPKDSRVAASDWLRDFKIVLLTEENLSADTRRVLHFATKINTQICRDLREVSKVSFSECISKKLIDDSTYLYLYKTKLMPENSSNHVDEVLGNLAREVA